MIPTAPCLDCPDRYLGCHDTCEKYLAYRKEQDIFNEKLRKERGLERVMNSYDKRRRRRKA